ncbi:hypothetical protein TPHA_0B03520 [Tetrapisispora phaffii CBS 4417]|uniref:Uncharacterized protein n=1 Tax=Tetrapisispora phaffii (strain ATCC 24235 / CBS 4417 / NBRC 1672 / NRRL Y-8282 / UCD 70-5) TaxID=1071381 RepID=G8BPU1_TETPH|nr:hypothetical protein TPHA_0B03520 [Tetrapisispora phaffii CBS 4417]CCE62022.1 hypothetical protein TPHA_0B03520 [Tetrapisispora phaffii CBS 4417]
MGFGNGSMMNIPRSNSTSDLFDLSASFSPHFGHASCSYTRFEKPTYDVYTGGRSMSLNNGIYKSSSYSNDSFRERRLKNHNANAYLLRRQQMQREFNFPNGEHFTPRYIIHNQNRRNRNMPRSNSLQNIESPKNFFNQSNNNNNMRRMYTSSPLKHSVSSSKLNLPAHSRNANEKNGHRPLKGSASTSNLGLDNINFDIDLNGSSMTKLDSGSKNKNDSKNKIDKGISNWKSDDKLKQFNNDKINIKNKKKTKIFSIFKKLFGDSKKKTLSKKAEFVDEKKIDDILDQNINDNSIDSDLLHDVTFDHEKDQEQILLDIDLVFDNLILQSDNGMLTSGEHYDIISNENTNLSSVTDILPPRSVKRPYIHNKKSLKQFYDRAPGSEDGTERILNRLTQEWHSIHFDDLDTTLLNSTSVSTIDSVASSTTTVETDDSKINSSMKKAFRFADYVHVSDTWSAMEYNRSDLSFRNNQRLFLNQNRNNLLDNIKNELNSFKSIEMEVHEQSRQNTQYFI